MRTTVTLEPDVERQLRDRMRERGKSFKEPINEVIRRGLRAGDPTPADHGMPVFEAEIRPGFDLDQALALAAAMEDEEILHRLRLGKGSPSTSTC